MVLSNGRSVEGQLVYAIGDIHGCYGQMKELLAQIARDYVARARGRRPVLVFLGDYVDRGPESAKVLEALVWLQRRTEVELHFLKGNHEQAMLQFIEDPIGAAAWVAFGGAETLSAYGVAPPRRGDPPLNLIRARDELMERMPASHYRMLQKLELMVTVGDYVFVHAGVRPGTPLEAQTEDDLLWLREGFVDAPGPFEKVVVHGHTWRDERPQILDHRIGVDTGCYATGVLTALRLDGEAVDVLQAGAVAPAAERELAEA